jgi:hypothetical protein
MMGFHDPALLDKSGLSVMAAACASLLPELEDRRPESQKPEEGFGFCCLLVFRPG